MRGDGGADDDWAGLGEQMVMRPVARMKGLQCLIPEYLPCRHMFYSCFQR